MIAGTGKLTKETGVNSNGDLWIFKAVELMEELEGEKHVKRLVNKDKELEELLVAALDLPCSRRVSGFYSLFVSCTNSRFYSLTSRMV